jgi:hypothetical protein
MTPQEKAEELYEAYFYCIPSFTDEGSIEHNTAKKCALIAVDEIINTLNFDIRDIDVRGSILLDLIDYWREVKQEIEKL